MKSLEAIISSASCESCREGGAKNADGKHVMFCNTPGCQPGTSSGHLYSCSSLTQNAEFMKQLRAYITRRIMIAKRNPMS